MGKEPKILFYFCGKPVYEGSEDAKLHKEAAEGGGYVEQAKNNIKQIDKIIKTKSK